MIKLYCSSCKSHPHAAGLELPPDTTGPMVCVSIPDNPTDPLNVYRFTKTSIEQHLKFTCPRCGEQTVTIEDYTPSVWTRIKRWIGAKNG